MSLDVPDLDDRTYADVLEDARKLLAVYTEEWTDHNVHDPGITFLELFAWLAETYGYQLDRVTDRHRRKYLELVGVRPRPPEPAIVNLKLELPKPADEEGNTPDGSSREGDPYAAATGEGWIGEGSEIRQGEQLTVDDGEGFVGVFETTKPVTLTGARVKRVVVRTTDGTLTDNSAANAGYGLSFLAFGERAERGSAMYVGLDRDPFRAEGTTIIDLTVDYHDEGLPKPEAHEPGDPEFEPSVDLAWEFFQPTGNGDDPDPDGGADDADPHPAQGEWRRFIVPPRRDRTDRLYHGGTVALEIDEAEWSGEAADLFGQGKPHVWLRCRVVESGYEIPPRLDSLRLDAVPARHLASHPPRHRASYRRAVLRRVEPGDVEEAGSAAERTETTARPRQTFAFGRAPILDATITIGGERWTEVEDFDASPPDARHYVLERAAGRLRFGDGVRGRVPDAGRRVVAERYTYGGGAAGNVPRSSDCAFVWDALSEITVTLEDDAEGGADAESVEDAMVRAREDLAKPYRAVRLSDYEFVAKTTPGLRFGRATARVRRHTTDGHDGDDEGREVVHVVVVPFSTLPDPPRPSRGFLEAVERHLERHRLLTDRVVVDPPTYVGVGVDAEVRLEGGYTPAGRRAAIADALDAFLDPLGADGEDGWPFGRPVYVSELYQVIERVPGVAGVFDVAVRARGEEGVDGDGNVLLGPSALPDPGDHGVRVRIGGGI
jgi:predicted phage baseplate assembly protein